MTPKQWLGFAALIGIEAFSLVILVAFGLCLFTWAGVLSHSF